MDQFYKPSGDLQGDTRAMPNRGTSTGMTGHATHADGMGLGGDDVNRLGGMGGATKSDPAMKNMPCGDGRSK